MKILFKRFKGAGAEAGSLPLCTAKGRLCTTKKAGRLTANPRSTLIAGGLCLIIILECMSACVNRLPVKQLRIEKQSGEKTTLEAEIADTQETRARGFMERKNIPDGTGMLFVFEVEQRLNFWMKNTPTALSIAFIGKDGTIKEIKDMQPFSLETVKSMYSCKYALEVPQGWFERAGVSVGDRLLIEDVQ